MAAFFHGTLSPKESANFYAGKSSIVIVYPIKDPGVDDVIVQIRAERTVVGAGEHTIFHVDKGTTLTVLETNGVATRYVVVVDSCEPERLDEGDPQAIQS